MAVGIATKNATATFCEYLERSQAAAGASGSSLNMAAVLQLMASDQGEKVCAGAIHRRTESVMSVSCAHGCVEHAVHGPTAHCCQRQRCA